MKGPAASYGDLKFRVRFDQKIETPDGYGGTVPSWSNETNGSFTKWAAIRPRFGGEGVQNARLTGTQPVDIIVRRDAWTKSVTPNWRAVQLEGETPVAYFDLKTAQDMEMEKQFITFLAVAGGADA